MIKKIILLEWKSLLRSAAFGTTLALKILMAFLALYFTVAFAALGTSVYFILEDKGFNPVQTVNQYMIYYFVADLAVRFFLQKTPVMNIRPLLSLNIKRSQVVHYAIGKTVLSFFNIVHLFFFLPFFVVLLIKGENALSATAWVMSMLSLIVTMNLLNILMDKKDYLFYTIAGILVVFGGLHYYAFFDITTYSGPVFQFLFDQAWTVILSFGLMLGLYKITYDFFHKNMYLDAGLAIKQELAQTQNLSWLDQYGTLGTFLKNDIKLILRNKRSKTTILMSLLFLFYGLLFFSDIGVYEGAVWKIFAGIFVSGGFLLTFGQFVPSWDSAYYPLMMSQNIKYRDYLNSKWWLMVIATLASTIVCSFYLIYGWEVYFAIIVGAIFNIGVNSHLVLWAGAYIKTPIDLNTNKNAFGDKKAFNLKTMIISIPKLVLPMALYYLGFALHSSTLGFILVAVAGVIGFAFKEKVFTIIENIYKSQKYDTIAAYKQKN